MTPTNPSDDSMGLDTVDRRFRSISLHSDGRWIVRYFNGKKKSLVSADSATEALDKFRAKLEAGRELSDIKEKKAKK